ncbi:Hypothetical predicted protein [Olea europaea subsp. europaea]|uniref:Uncharacterized protein n=1 Tax=Olea europaea subsp. europaea TaxID=158383 RepID=A0A8S0ULR8_OLEEU|nr:Hypothetical predicted protein [Olea europaea subsp. europaea]
MVQFARALSQVQPAKVCGRHEFNVWSSSQLRRDGPSSTEEETEREIFQISGQDYVCRTREKTFLRSSMPRAYRGFRSSWAQKFVDAKEKKENVVTYTVHSFSIAMQIWAFEAMLEIGDRFEPLDSGGHDENSTGKAEKEESSGESSEDDEELGDGEESGGDESGDGNDEDSDDGNSGDSDNEHTRRGHFLPLCIYVLLPCMHRPHLMYDKVHLLERVS